MKTFEVTIVERRYYSVTVEAENESMARELCWDKFPGTKEVETQVDVFDIMEVA